ncbi:hypothetical protein GCM10010532_080150 [Dactylosporangium siamense]|uniref:Uncharacterized protein n=1 Tax=Dactylosporangium siamense TaxID=685454 RepID=A0A919UEP6_9ACTN|nr:hypothetical protein Dsi01nite_068910 [Dactylosporangium siamense]
MSQPDAASRCAIPAPIPIERPTPVTSATGRAVKDGSCTSTVTITEPTADPDHKQAGEHQPGVEPNFLAGPVDCGGRPFDLAVRDRNKGRSTPHRRTS